MTTVRQAIALLRANGALLPRSSVSVANLMQLVLQTNSISVRDLLESIGPAMIHAHPRGLKVHPYYRRSLPEPSQTRDFANDGSRVELTNAHLDPYPPEPIDHAAFNGLFDRRAAAAISALVGLDAAMAIGVVVPFGSTVPVAAMHQGFLESKTYEEAPSIMIPRVKCLAAMAHTDYFPGAATHYLRRLVSNCIRFASPGWCGSFGPGVDHYTDVFFGSPAHGDYDMTQMHLLQIAYRYYDHLSLEARNKLITLLLASGRIHRPNLDDTLTSGGNPIDYSRAGYIDPFGLHHVRIGETENHILMILTARYLTNQLLYQRDHDPQYDNRRNGSPDIVHLGLTVRGRPHCTSLLLSVLRDILADDFSEYNAKPYMHEMRTALLNLCSYAYDHEVRLAARMVLDYLAARMATSSNDLRRLVPFRRINDILEDHPVNSRQLPTHHMDVGLLEWALGADHMVEPYAMQAGNLRAFVTPNHEHLPPPNDQFEARPWTWAIAGAGGDATMEALSDYRLPPLIHDLFVNDRYRRFFQRLHRTVMPDIQVTGRNCDNHEISAGSPSYLISAGGSPAPWAVWPDLAALFDEEQVRQLGVAVPTSFMPTGQSAGPERQNSAHDLIQFGSFSQTVGEVANYGVAPDFACGHSVHLPDWVDMYGHREGPFLFVDRGPTGRDKSGPAGFYLAIFRNEHGALLEALDTWHNPGVTFDDFKTAILRRHPRLWIDNNVETDYQTLNGNRLRFVIWHDVERDAARFGAKIVEIAYGPGLPIDTLAGAGHDTSRFLSGTVMNSPALGVVDITNPFGPFAHQTIRLDMSDPLHPKRTAETGAVEIAGANNEVWLDVDWTGPSEGDFFRPFRTLAAAAAAVADGGTIRIVPGVTSERLTLGGPKRFRLTAPIGAVTLGVR